MALGVERCNNSSDCLCCALVTTSSIQSPIIIAHLHRRAKTWQSYSTRRHDAGGSPHRDMPQIIVKNHLDKNTLRCVQISAKARVISASHGKINLKASFKENRQRNNIVFRFLHEQGRTGLGVCCVNHIELIRGSEHRKCNICDFSLNAITRDTHKLNTRAGPLGPLYNAGHSTAI